MRRHHENAVKSGRRRGLHAGSLRAYLASAALGVVAIFWWVGLFGPNNVPIVGGFGTLFLIVAVFCLGLGIYRQIVTRGRDER